jgi:hypothetical protein
MSRTEQLPLLTCTRCGGTGREVLSLGERAILVCLSCEREARLLLTAFVLRQRIVCGEPDVSDEPEPPITELENTFLF